MQRKKAADLNPGAVIEGYALRDSRSQYLYTKEEAFNSHARFHVHILTVIDTICGGVQPSNPQNDTVILYTAELGRVFVGVHDLFKVLT